MKRILFFVFLAVLALGTLFTYEYYRFHDGRLHIVFCDVGQGDGILITTPSNKQILIDAGPSRKILDCLSKHMPFWDREIELAMITHPHADHFMGYYYVIDRYGISQLASEDLVNKTDAFEGLIKKIENKKIPQQIVYGGDRWVISQQEIAATRLSGSRNDEAVVVSIAGPSKEFIARKDPDGIITNSAESASLAILVSYKDFSALLTGDAPLDEMQEIAERGIEDLDVLQIPHHGSNTGIDSSVLDLLSPNLAIISVGKNNYGHPTKEVLDMLGEKNMRVLRTDQMGDVEIVSDGKMRSVK